MSRWLLVLCAACASATTSSQQPSSAQPSTPATQSQPPATTGTWIELPDMQRRVRCDAEPAKVMFSSTDPPMATVHCGPDLVAIVRLGATTLDDAIREVHASMRTLQSQQRSEARGTTSYRVDHENLNGWRKKNYWIDQVTQISGSFYMCQASGMGDGERDGDPAVAERGAAICKTLE